ncbi:MAG: cystathionine beta-lyase [Edaphobacter sp.]|nr:cystathionine beta-lyase [Edaphobacter sp.]
MKWQSKIIHPKRNVSQKFESLAFPTYRGSTVVFASHEVVRDGWRDNVTDYSYGAYGTPTALELGARIAELEGAKHSFIVPSGQASIALIYLSLCSAGNHVLVPSTAYGPNVEFGTRLLQQYQVEVELYDPLIGGEIQDRMRPETALVWCESPSSITMEVQDVPAIVEAAHQKNVPVALDNTYAAGVLFDAFAHGVDVSMQALTKYAAGHSDVLGAGFRGCFKRLFGCIRRAHPARSGHRVCQCPPNIQDRLELGRRNKLSHGLSTSGTSR